MSERPESIWKKSWKGPKAFIAWFLILACAIFVVVFALELLSAKNNSIKELLRLSILISLTATIALSLLFAFFRWLFCWNNLRRATFSLVCLTTLIALIYTEENWRGKHAWEKYKREQEAKGERFDFKSMAPPPVPDEQNFAMTPIWVEEVSGIMGMKNAMKWYGDKVSALGHTNFFETLAMPIELNGIGLEFTNSNNSWQKGEKVDLKLWQEYYRKLAVVTAHTLPQTPAGHLLLVHLAEMFQRVLEQPRTPAKDVLLALSKYDSTIEALRAASKLPHSRFPLGYGDDDPAGILVPHLASLKGCVINLQLRSSAELQAGETEKAFEDVKLMLRLTESIRNEPILISHLIRIAMLQIAFQTVWEGLAENKWNEEQLIALDTELGKLDFLADYNFSMRGERALGVGVIDYLRRNRREFENFDGINREDFSKMHTVITLDRIMFSPLNRLVPNGWLEQNKIAVCQMHSEYLFPIVNLQTRAVSLATAKRASDAWNGDGKNSTVFNWFTRLLSPPKSNPAQKFAHAQSFTDMARIACALERYRLAHGGFPETLDVLTPKFLKKIPHDIINGEPLNYHLTGDGQFVLYSIGWNETDDGGKVGLTQQGNVEATQGDWVWKYPAK